MTTKYCILGLKYSYLRNLHECLIVFWKNKNELFHDFSFDNVLGVLFLSHWIIETKRPALFTQQCVCSFQQMISQCYRQMTSQCYRLMLEVWHFSVTRRQCKTHKNMYLKRGTLYYSFTETSDEPPSEPCHNPRIAICPFLMWFTHNLPVLVPGGEVKINFTQKPSACLICVFGGKQSDGSGFNENKQGRAHN